MRDGKPVHRARSVATTRVFSIVARYQAEYRGVVQYYRLAYEPPRLSARLRWIMESSLTKTLAQKLRVTVTKVYRRYQTTFRLTEGP